MRKRDFVTMAGPSILVMLVLLTLPIAFTVMWSFQSVDYSGGGSWVGLENYTRAIKDSEFRSAVVFTSVFALAQTVLVVVLGYALALLMNRARRGRSVFLGLILVPYVIPAVIACTAFGWLFDDNFGGLVNFVLEHVIGTRFNWFSDTWPNRVLLMMAVVWISVPFAMIIFLAALKGFPGELRDAAMVDGAGWWQQQVYIVVPYIRPMITFVALISTMDGLRLYDPLIPLAPSAAANGNLSISLFVFQRAFARANQDLGLGSAVNVLMILAMVALTLPLLRGISTQGRSR